LWWVILCGGRIGRVEFSEAFVPVVVVCERVGIAFAVMR
jgi:hypothetical protein